MKHTTTEEAEYMDARTDEERAADAKIKSTTTAEAGVYTPPPSRAAREAAINILRKSVKYWTGMSLSTVYEKRIQLNDVINWMSRELDDEEGK